jgi:asparagine synthase (glutamine-hydrolysing)
MRLLFADVLPEEIISRRTKALFGESFWGHYSREFGRSWNGEGVNPELVDVDALRGFWVGIPPPPAPTLVLLKQAWLAANEVAQRSESTSTSRPPALAS